MEKLVVDCAYYVTKYPNHIMVKIDDEYYMIPFMRKDNESKTFNKIEKIFAEHAKKDKFKDHDYPINHLKKKSGYTIELGRQINKKEFDDLKKSLNLTEEDISKPFQAEKGTIYGEEYAKKYTCIQICVKTANAIDIEEKLRKKGIEAASIAPGRINIRIEH